MKKTVGVITMYKDNYGAFLQAYALQKILLQLGYSPELINYHYDKDFSIFGVSLLDIRKPKMFIKRIIVEILMYKKHYDRRKIFQKSIEKNLIVSKESYRTYKALKNNPPQYDVYLSGSDQVFNTNLIPHAIESRLLMFAKDRKKVSYAASAGNVEYNDKETKLLVNELSKFSNISVREEQFEDFLSEYFDDVQTHIDPTLVLQKQDWAKFSRIPKDIEERKGKYIFYYRVLGQSLLEEEAIKLSEKIGLPIYAVDGNTKFPNQIKRTHFLSPEEWIGALANAEYVITNSFHGTALSIKYQKKVRVIVPPKGAERINHLVEKCGLSRLYDADLLLDEEVHNLYAKSVEYFVMERENTLKYLSVL